MSKIKVLIDCSELNPLNPGGVRSYTLNITSALVKNPDLIVSIVINEESENLFQEIMGLLPKHSVLIIKKKKRVLKTLLRICEISRLSRSYLALKSRRIIKITQNDSFDFVYTPTTSLNHEIYGVPNLVTLHDIQEKDLPSNFPLTLRRYRDFRNSTTLKKAQMIHISSNFIKQSIKRNYPRLFSEERMFIVPEGVDTSRFRSSAGGKKRQIIFPARSWQHKNHSLFFNSLALLREKNPPKIILTGCSENEFKSQVNLDVDFVEFKGQVSESELTSIFKESFAVLSCSLYESSSLPILEGISAGCLAIASSIPAHLEMAQNLDLELFSPNKPQELADAILKATNMYDRNLIKTSRNNERIEDHDWKNIAENLVGIFREKKGNE